MQKEDSMVKSRYEMQERRVEQKFLVGEEQAREIGARVREHLELDRHSANTQDRSYQVHSVYLDSETLESYWDTRERKNNRFKLRVRFYDDDSSQPVFVEIKGKAEKQTIKKRCPVPRHDLKQILAARCQPAINWIDGMDDALAMEEFMRRVERLRAQPKLHVAYRREAYVSADNNAMRVTFDRDVRSEPVKGLRLTTRMEEPKELCSGEVVIEIKTIGMPPAWLNRLVQDMELDSCRFTKYVFGIEQHGLNLDIGARSPG
jgi:hypothetical protein